MASNIMRVELETWGLRDLWQEAIVWFADKTDSIDSVMSKKEPVLAVLDEWDSVRAERLIKGGVLEVLSREEWETRGNEIVRRCLLREAQKEKEHRAALLRAFIANPFATLVLSPSFEIMAANEAYLKSNGRTLDELVGKHLFEAVDLENEGQINLRKSLERVLESGDADSMTVRLKSGDNEERFFSAISYPYFNSDALEFIVHRVVDFTGYFQGPGIPGEDQLMEQEKTDLMLCAQEIQSLNSGLRKSEERLTSLFDGVGVGICTLDHQGLIVYANSALLGMLKIPLDAARGLDFTSLLDSSDRPIVNAYEELLNQGQGFVHEHRIGTSGHEIWVRVSATSRLEGADSHHAILALEDVSQRREAERVSHKAQYLWDLAGRFARIGGWEVDLALDTATWSETVCQIHEVPIGSTFALADCIEFYLPKWRGVVADAVETSRNTGEPFDFEAEIETTSGRHVWVRAVGEVVLNEDRAPIILRGAFQDISAQKESESQLIEREAAFHDLAESFPHIMWRADESGVIDYTNSKLADYCGIQLTQGSSDQWVNVIPDSEQGRVSSEWVRCVSEGRPFRAEFRIRRHDGELRWHLVQADPVHDSDGRVLRWYGSASDVHDQHLIEEEVRSIAERLSQTLESITDAVFTLDREWTFRFLNARAQDLLERSADDLLGKVFWDAFPEAQGTLFESEYMSAMEDGETSQFEAYYPPLQKWFRVFAYPYEEGLTVFFQDVTQAHELAESARQAETRFRHVARATSDAIWDWDLETDSLWWSPGITDTFGVARKDLEPDSLSWKSRLHPEDLESVLQSVLNAIHGDSETWSAAYRFKRGDGTFAHVFDRGFVIRDAQGSAVRMVGGMSDHTQEFESLQRLREQAELLDRAQDAILVRDLSSNVVFWNAGAQRMYGFSQEEIARASVRSLLYDDPQTYDEASRKVLDKGEWMGELTHQTKTGAEICVEGRWSLVRDARGEPYRILEINTDVTERKKLVNQFLRAQRLESIGTLAGGIAHDLNNMLAPILMSISLLKMGETQRNKLQILDTIESSARRGADMVKQVLSFARGTTGEHRVVNLRAILDELASVVRDTFPGGVVLKTSIEDDLWMCQGDPTQIHQVLLNLFVNSRDAMPNGGTLKVEVKNVEIDHQFAVMTQSRHSGSFVCIVVTDTGAGMTQEVMERAFDPFYTTKPVGSGTGLGLSTLAAIVKAHNGFYNLYSEPGKGTTFNIYLPATHAPEIYQSENHTEPKRGNGEWILVVDDERSVREVTKQTLEVFGYSVLTAGDGAEAIAVFSRSQEKISLVITDIMMPVMDGVAAIHALKHLSPSLKIIAASGYGANDGVARAAGEGVKSFLAKPYSAETLLETVYRVLHSKEL